MRPRATGKGLNFAVDYATHVPDRIITDPTRLRQILVNLVGNAVKFTEHGVVRMWCVTKAPAPPPDSRTRVPFARTSPSTLWIRHRHEFRSATDALRTFRPGRSFPTRRYGGSGLGLPSPAGWPA